MEVDRVNGKFRISGWSDMAELVMCFCLRHYLRSLDDTSAAVRGLGAIFASDVIVNLFPHIDDSYRIPAFVMAWIVVAVGRTILSAVSVVVQLLKVVGWIVNRD